MVGVGTAANGGAGAAVAPAGGGGGGGGGNALAAAAVTKAASAASNGTAASNGGGALAGGGGSGDLTGNGGASSGGEEKVRNPRWMMHETVVLVAAKRKHDEEAGDEYVPAHKKWGTIAVEVKEKGVDRDARQCRKRWSNLYQDYRRIRDWLKTNGEESYWTMRHDKRRDNKLPGSFDKEVYNDMDTFLAKKKGIIPRSGSGDSAQRIQDSEGPGSEVEQDQDQDQDVVDAADEVVVNGDGSSSPGKVDMEKDPATDSALDDRKKRHSKWTKHETVVLLYGKSTYDYKSKNLSASSKAVRSDEKWDSISAYCMENGVDRDAQQCRKRWSNLHNGDYKKIKDWQKKGEDSYWEMKSEDRRLRKLPGSFDLQVYKVMDDYCTKKGTGDLESVRPALEKLLAEVDQEHEDQNGLAIVRKDDDQPAAAPAPDSEAMQAVDNGSLGIHGSKKRKRTSSIEGVVMEVEHQSQLLNHCDSNLSDKIQMDDLATALESSGRTMHQILTKNVQAQIEAQKASSELDRNQRKQQGDNLVNVLNKLAEAMAKIAEKL